MAAIEFQARARGPRGGDSITSPAQDAVRTAGQPLDRQTRAFMEPRFGHDLSRVRVHTDARAAETAAQLEARAFTLGNDVVFGAGEYLPATSGGQRLLAHELAHTIQQQRLSPPALQTKLRLSEAGDALDVSADRAADAVMAGERAPALTPAPAGLVQRQRAGRTCTRGTPSGDVTPVRCSDGAEYDVRTTITPGFREPQTQTGVTGGLAALTTLFFRVTVCRGGTRVRVTTGMNVARPLQDVIRNVLRGSPLLQGVQLQPQADIEFTVSRDLQVQVFGGPTIVPGVGTGGRGGVRVQVGGVTLEGSVSSDPTLRGPGGGPSVRVDLGAGVATDPVPAVDCSAPREGTIDYECRRVSYTTPVQPQAADDVEVYVFFDYAMATVIPPTPVIQRGSVVDARATPQSLAAEGFRAQSIEAFTSPEGPLSVPRARAAPGRFIDNQRLAEDRGVSARDWLRANCPLCIGPNEPVPVAGGELHGGGTQPELRGDALTRRAREGFLGSVPNEPRDPLARPDDDARLPRLSPAQQRAEIYPRLRRAVIRMHKPEVQGRDAQRVPGAAGSCPSDVRNAMQAQDGRATSGP